MPDQPANKQPRTRRSRPPAEKPVGGLSRLAVEDQAAVLRTMFAHSLYGVAFFDCDLVVLAANEIIAEWRQLPLDQIVGRTAAVVVPGWSEKAARVFQTVRETGQPYQSEAFPVVLEGQPEQELIYWEASISPVFGAQAGFLGFLVLLRDVTARKRAEVEREELLEIIKLINEQVVVASLQAQESAEEAGRRVAELDAVIDAVADGLIIYGPSGEITRLNATAARLLGLSPEQYKLPVAERLAIIQAETWDGQPFPPEELPGARALRGETVRGVGLVIHGPQGAAWISASAAPIRAPDGRFLGAVCTFVDLTAAHELQEQRDDLVQMVSHDLRNPLTTVQGQAQFLKRTLERMGIGGHLYRSVDAVITCARRMNAMIQDMVDSTRLETGQLRLEKQPVMLKAFLKELLDRDEKTMDIARVSVDIPEDLPPLEADPNRLERILINLINNALKYSPPDTKVLVQASAAGRGVAISVTDRGQGIPPEDLPRVFDRFYRASDRHRVEGLGLGLYITRRLVEAHGGHISVASEPGQGTTFTFILPSSTPLPPAASITM